MSLPVITRPWAGTTRVSGTTSPASLSSGADAAAQPGAVSVVEDGPFLRGHDSAGDQQVHLWKMDVEIPVGVGRGQVAVVDLLAGELQGAVTARGPIRPGSLGHRGPAAFERHRVDRVAQVHPRLLVGEDDAAIATNRFVGACLLGMPVRVDQRVDATAGCRVPDGRKQGISIGRKAAIDHQCAVAVYRNALAAFLWAGHRDHVAAGTLEQCRAAQSGG